MATVTDIDSELIKKGIRDNPNSELQQNYEKLKSDLERDSENKRPMMDLIDSLWHGYQTASANEKIYNGLYRELTTQLNEEHKNNKILQENSKEEKRELEQMTLKYNELKSQQNQAKEDVNQKEAIKNDFTVSDRQNENEIDEGKLQDLQITNEKLNSDLEEAKNLLQEKTKELKQIKEEFESLTIEKNQINLEKIECEKKLETTTALNAQEKENRDMDLKLIKEKSAKFKKDYDDKQLQYLKMKDDYDKKDKECEGIRKKHEAVTAELKKLQFEFDGQNKKIEKINNEKKIIIQREKDALEQVKKVKDERDLFKKQAINSENEVKEKNRRIDRMGEKIDTKEKLLDELKGQIQEKDNDIVNKRKQIELNKQKIDHILREKNDAENERKKEEDLYNEKKEELKKMNSNYQEVLSKLDQTKQELNLVEKTNKDLDRERNKMTDENTKAKNRIEHLLEDMKLGDNRVQELQKKVVEYEKKLKMQREVYDAARREKNLYFKNLIETQDDLVERQNLLQFNKKEIENLKSDLKKKDDHIVEVKQKNTKYQKKLKGIELERDKIFKELQSKKEMCNAQEKEMEKLKINVEETAKNYAQLEAEYKKTISSRDNLSSQLIRRNDEVSILHEKIMILTTDMSKLEKEIQERNDKLSIQNRNIQDLNRELKINQKFKEKSEAYARELININKELLREKNLNKALTEEVESSEKLFHRWRKLEGIDPDSLELHYKISLLQKRLISKTEECVEKEITIQDLTKELANCKKLANKKPLFEIEESIKKYKQELSKQYDRMKSIISELNMYRNQVEEYKTDNNRIKKENVDLQNKYHELKIRTNNNKLNMAA